MKTLLILAVLLCMSIAFAIKCNVCVSTESMDKCESSEKLQECPSTFDSCFKSSQEYESGGIHIKAFAKGCSTQQLCDQALQTCKSHSGATCEVDCCHSDGCNGGSVPFAIKCNVCVSTESMDKCKSIEKLQECPAPFDSCAKISQEYESGGIHIKAFGKGCSTQEVCEQTLQACKSHSEASCEVDCCDSDGCNSGTVPVVSIFLLATCALMGLICMSDINM